MDKLTDYLRYGDVIFRGVRHPADSIRSAVDDLAAYLRREHRGNSPFVYLFAPNHVKTVISYFAIIKAGFACVLLDPQVGRLELEEYEQDTPPGILIRINSATESFDKGAEIEFRDIRVRLKDDLEGVCTMVYTAADDGYAKAAMLTHENIYSNAAAIALHNRVRDSSASSALVHVYHLFGLQTGMIVPAVSGTAALVCEMERVTRMAEVLKQVERHKVTHVYSVPAVYYMITRTPDARRLLRSVRGVVSGAYKLTEALFEKVRTSVGMKIREGYGLTEAGPVCTSHRPEDTIKPHTVGRSNGFCTLSIMDGGDGQCGVGEAGRVCVQGPNVLKGYYGHPHLSEKRLVGGWLDTGDRGALDSQGYLVLYPCDRAFVNVGGRKVYMPEIERMVSRISNVKSVRAFGVAHELAGETLNMRIQFRNGGQQAVEKLRKWMVENITSYKVPRIVTVTDEAHPVGLEGSC